MRFKQFLVIIRNESGKSNETKVNQSTCNFKQEYAEGSGYYGKMMLEKIRFSGSLTVDPEDAQKKELENTGNQTLKTKYITLI